MGKKLPGYIQVTLRSGPKSGQSFRLPRDQNEIRFAPGEDGQCEVYELKLPPGAKRSEVLTAIAVYQGRRRR